MRIRLITSVLITITAAFGVVCAQKSMTLDELRNMNKDKVNTKEDKSAQDKSAGTSLITEGAYSKVEKPFLFVARDAETYSQLAALIGEFDQQEIDFSKYAVVAAFSGEKMTGGYGVSIKMKDGKCEIEDVEPPHGAIVTDALTRPFALSAVEVQEENSLNIVAGETWDTAFDKYIVSKGEFKFSGGFIGISKKFGVEGSVSTMRYGDHITLMFNIREASENGARTMVDIGSGILNGKKPAISRLEAGSLIDKPHPPFKVTATFENAMLKLMFKPGKRSYVVNDGFEGSGFIEAVLSSRAAD